MIWHGRRHDRNRHAVPHGVPSGLLIILIAFAAVDFAAAQAPSPPNPSAMPLDRRIELQWKSETPRRWSGKIELVPSAAPGSDDGPGPNPVPALSDPVNLTPGPILSGGIFITARGAMQFGPPARLSLLPEGEGKLASVLTTRGGISFRVSGDAADKLVLRLDGDAEAAAVVLEFPLDQLDAGQRVEKSIDQRGVLSMRRLNGDMLRVRFGTGNTIFAPGDVVDIAVQGQLAGRPDGGEADLVLQCHTIASVDQTVVGTETWPVKLDAGKITVSGAQWTAPAAEGAYRVRWHLQSKTSPRGGGTKSAKPLAIATSWTQSIGEAIPLSLAAPFHLPLGSPPALLNSTEAGVIAQSEFSLAVIAPQMPKPPQSLTALPERSSWRLVGKAEVSETVSSVSRLLPRQTSDWIATTALNPRSQRPAIHDAKRLTILEPGSQLEYTVPLASVGQRHRALIRIPNGTSLQIAVELFDGAETSATPPSHPASLGPGLVITRTGIPVSSEPWHLAAIDFWPRSLSTRMVLTNTSTAEAASIESVEVHVENGDVLDHSGEAVSPSRLAAMRLELDDLFVQFGDGRAPSIESPLDYHGVWVAGNRLIEVLRREGYGGVILTVSSDGATLYPSKLALADGSWDANWSAASGPVDALELLLRMFDRASLRLVPCVRPSAPLLALEQAILRGSAEAGSIAAPSPLGGQTGKWSFDGPPVTAFGIYDATHPLVAQQVGAVLGELSHRCTHHRCVSTIGVLADERTYLRLPPIAVTDPPTLNAFHAALGDAAPPRANLALWTQNEGAQVFEQWRAERAQRVLQQILEQSTHQSLLVMSLDSALPSTMVELGRDPRILTTRLHRRSLIEPLGLRIRDEACNASAAVTADPAKTLWTHDVAVFHQPITELRRADRASVAVPPWPRRDMLAAAAGATVTPLLDPEESSLAFAQLLNRSDRQVIAIGGGGVNQPGSDTRRRSMGCFTQLPPVVMTDVIGEKNAMSGVRVRHARYRGDSYIYAVNQTRLPVAIDMALSRAASITPLGRDQGAAAAERAAVARQVSFEDDPPGSRRQATAAARWDPVLAAGELVAVRISGDDIDILNWKANFAAEEPQLAMIRTSIQDAVGCLPQLATPAGAEVIENGGFELAAGEGVAGWLTAQYPPGCVAIDQTVAFQGSQSLRLSGPSGQVGGSWIVSQVISPPRSGRVAVSVRLRGEPSDQPRSAAPLVVRMALEGTVGGTPIHQTRSIAVPRDGKWSEPAERLEIALLPSVPVESLRLTIDLMSSGVVWIDEVSFSDHFLTSAEKTQLEHLVFLAAGGVSRGDWTAASRLLDSHWAQDLARLSVVDKARDSSAAPPEGRPLRAAQRDAKEGNIWGSKNAAVVPSVGSSSSSAEQPRPGMAERLKSWLPRPVRF